MAPARLGYMGLGMSSFQVVGGPGEDAWAETELVGGSCPHGEGNGARQQASTTHERHGRHDGTGEEAHGDWRPAILGFGSR
jgi:hypothetical protein